MANDIHSSIVKINYVMSVLADINGDIQEGMGGRALKTAESNLAGLIKLLGFTVADLKKLEAKDSD